MERESQKKSLVNVDYFTVINLLDFFLITQKAPLWVILDKNLINVLI